MPVFSPHDLRHRRISLLAIFATALITVGLATAAAPTGNKISCFGDCTQVSPNKATFGQGGVYIVNQPGNQLVGNVSKLSFKYSGTQKPSTSRVV